MQSVCKNTEILMPMLIFTHGCYSHLCSQIFKLRFGPLWGQLFLFSFSVFPAAVGLTCIQSIACTYCSWYFLPLLTKNCFSFPFQSFICIGQCQWPVLLLFCFLLCVSSACCCTQPKPTPSISSDVIHTGKSRETSGECVPWNNTVRTPTDVMRSKEV